MLYNLVGELLWDGALDELAVGGGGVRKRHVHLGGLGSGEAGVQTFCRKVHLIVNTNTNTQSGWWGLKGGGERG